MSLTKDTQISAKTFEERLASFFLKWPYSGLILYLLYMAAIGLTFDPDEDPDNVICKSYN